MAPTELETGMPQLNLHRSLPRRLKSLEPSRHASDDDSRPENDETEARLEKLIFGDEAGFLDSLKNHDVGETLTQKLPSGNVGEGLRRDEDLENVPDEDVRQRIPYGCLCNLLLCNSSSFLTLDLALQQMA